MVAVNAILTAQKWPVGVSRLSRLIFLLGSCVAQLRVTSCYRRSWGPRLAATTQNSLVSSMPLDESASSSLAVHVCASLLIPNTRLVSRLVLHSKNRVSPQMRRTLVAFEVQFPFLCPSCSSHAGNARNDCADVAASVSENNFPSFFFEGAVRVFLCNAFF